MDVLSNLPVEGEFTEGNRVRAVAQTSGARATYARVSERTAVILLIDPTPEASVAFAPGWSELRREALPGVQVIVATRT